MNSETKPTENIKEDPIKAEIRFYLTDGCCHINSIITTKSRIKDFEDSLSKNLENQEGFIYIKGSPESEDDFYFIKTKSISAISFKKQKQINS